MFPWIVSLLQVIFLPMDLGFGSANIQSQEKGRKLMNGVNGRWLGRIQSLPLIFQVSKIFIHCVCIFVQFWNLCIHSFSVALLKDEWTFEEVVAIMLVFQRLWCIFWLVGQPLNISAAYSGRIACAYKYGKSFTRPSKNDPDSRYVNLCVAIYECESTGGKKYCNSRMRKLCVAFSGRITQ